jgi:hypothetical protein
MALHFLVVYILVFVEFSLVDASLRVESVLIQVTLFIKLLVNIGGFH